MTDTFDVLRERGFVQQATDEAAVRRALAETVVTGYVGFDPTADSLHIGNLVQIMALAHLQRGGHHPIAIVGGGTAMVGDPSGKTELRKMLTREQIQANITRIKAQLSRYLDFEDGRAILVDNTEWLLDLKYIDFLRDIGRHFSVNRMLTAESYKSRLETGLTFLEFNYQLLQAYDYLMLYRRYGCTLQMGGDDQWGNILAGVDLIRRLEGTTVHAITTPLITTADGRKMGKTATGSVWLDPEKCSPYDFYQFWINTDDRDVGRFLTSFTMLPMDEVRKLAALQGADLRQAKTVLAFEATRLTHGEDEARKAQHAARSVFGEETEGMTDLPTSTISPDRIEAGIPVTDLFVEAGLCTSKSEARRLIQGGGAYLNGERIDDFEMLVTPRHVRDGPILLRAGKKRYHRVVLMREE